MVFPPELDILARPKVWTDDQTYIISLFMSTGYNSHSAAFVGVTAGKLFPSKGPIGAVYCRTEDSLNFKRPVSLRPCLQKSLSRVIVKPRNVLDDD